MSSVSQSESAPEPGDLSRQAALAQSTSRGKLVEELRQQVGRWGASTAEEATVFSCGAAAVDQLLPRGGLRHGMLVEWLGTKVGTGAATLGLLGAREACREGGVLVVIDRPRTFYPPAAAAWGIDLDRLIVIHPQNTREELWAAVQALRSPVVAALWASIERLDSRSFRRLQLAAEGGRTLGVLVRPAAARGQPTWANLQLEVGSWSAVHGPLHSNHGPRTTNNGRFVQVRVLHCHPGRAGGSVVLEIDDVVRTVEQVNWKHDTHPLSVVAELGDSASRSLPARA